MRKNYIDYVRLLLCFLVILTHTSISFGAMGGWFYVSPLRLNELGQVGFNMQVAINQSYFMSLFFFISALFLPGSIERKGVKAFLKDRLFRLVVPLLVYTFVLNPLLRVLFLNDRFHFSGFGPMWFVATLIVLELLYIALRKVINKIKMPKVTFGSVALFVILAGFMAFLVRIKMPFTRNVLINITLGFFVLYVLMYLLGLIVCRSGALEKLSMKKGWVMLVIAVMSLPVAYFCIFHHSAEFVGGGSLASLAYALWESVMCVCVSYFILSFGKHHVNGASRFWQGLAGDSYMVYIIHPFFVVGFTRLLENSGANAFVCLMATLVLSLVCGFIVARLLRVVLHKIGYQWI